MSDIGLFGGAGCRSSGFGAIVCRHGDEQYALCDDHRYGAERPGRGEKLQGHCQFAKGNGPLRAVSHRGVAERRAWNAGIAGRRDGSDHHDGDVHAGLSAASGARFALDARPRALYASARESIVAPVCAAICPDRRRVGNARADGGACGVVCGNRRPDEGGPGDSIASSATGIAGPPHVCGIAVRHRAKLRRSRTALCEPPARVARPRLCSGCGRHHLYDHRRCAP